MLPRKIVAFEGTRLTLLIGSENLESFGRGQFSKYEKKGQGGVPS